MVGVGEVVRGNLQVNPISTYIDSRITFQRRPKICVAALGDSAGMIGAGILAAKAVG
jgi:hypothetical protein